MNTKFFDVLCAITLGLLLAMLALAWFDVLYFKG